jgi:hypothetical protein
VPVGGAVELSDLPIEAIVEEAIRQLEVEVTSQGLLDLLDAHAIIEDAVEDGLADLVVVMGLGRDALDLGAEGGAAVAGSPVFGGGDMEEEDGLVGEGANGAFVEVLASAESSTARAGSLLGGVAAVEVVDLGSWVRVGSRSGREAYNGHGVNSWPDGS